MCYKYIAIALINVICVWQKRDKAHVLLQKVFEHLELIEKEYFGLQFIDHASGAEGMVRLDMAVWVNTGCCKV